MMRDAVLGVARRLARALPARLAIVEGHCLHPVVRDGDVVLIRSLPSRGVRVGEYVTACVGAATVVKRVGEVGAHDVALEAHEPYLRVGREALRGRVVAVVSPPRIWRWRRLVSAR